MRGKRKKRNLELLFSACVADPMERVKKQEFLMLHEKGEKWDKESVWCLET